MERNNNYAVEYEVYDGCYGTVTGSCSKGAFLEPDNGQEAFAYKFASLRPGSKVLCSVVRKPTESQRMLVSIDHVCHYAAA